MPNSEQETTEVGGRDIGAYVEHTKQGSNRIIAVYPIPKDGGQGYAFSDGMSGSLDVWGIESPRGSRIHDAYQSGKLPCNDRDELNKILRPDEFEDNDE